MGKLLGQSWEQLADIARQGTWAENNIEIGDYKALTLNGTVGTVVLNNYTVYATVIGFDHNKDKEIIGYPHAITFGLFANINKVQICLLDSYYNKYSTSSASFAMNPANGESSSTNAGGWRKAKIRKNVIGSTDIENGDATPAAITNPGTNTLMAALPADLRAVLKPITKYTDNTGHKATGESAVTPTIDYLPMLAEYEVFGKRHYANANEQTYQEQYEFYANGGSAKRYAYNDLTNASLWTARSPYSGDNYRFCTISDYDQVAQFAASGFCAGLAAIFNICSDGSPDYINIDQTTLTVVLATKDTHVSKDISVQAILSEKTVTPTTTAQTVTPSNNTVGLSKVTVNAVPTEEKTIAPAFTDKVVTPSSGKFLSKVTISAITNEETTVTPTNQQQIVMPSADVQALSKVTVNAVPTEEKTYTQNGVYVPTSGKFISKVTINVASTGYDRVVTVGDDINLDGLPYDSSYNILSTDTNVVTVQDDGGVWYAQAVGTGEATIEVEDSEHVVQGRLKVKVDPKPISGYPIEVATAAEMANLLVQKNVGKVYKFTGTTDDTYTNGDFYVVEATT